MHDDIANLIEEKNHFPTLFLINEVTVVVVLAHHTIYDLEETYSFP